VKANNNFINQPLEFWANVRLISQYIGYTAKKPKKKKAKKGEVVVQVAPEKSKVGVPTVDEIIKEYTHLGLKYDHLINEDKSLTGTGHHVIEYFKYRADVLNNFVEPLLMNKEQARELFEQTREQYNPTCPIPINRQKLAEGQPYYFTGIINMIVEANAGDCAVNYNPGELTTFNKDGYPLRTLSRRMDGAFPDVVNPVAIWEIKEYYYTTTFGSKISDGVFETQLDGMEFREMKDTLKMPVGHYLMVDAYYTWWEKGRSYLCRIVDMLHMGILTEVLFGKEILDRLPVLTKEWVAKCEEMGIAEKKTK
jgi:hypothetical protein